MLSDSVAPASAHHGLVVVEASVTVAAVGGLAAPIVA